MDNNQPYFFGPKTFWFIWNPDGNNPKRPHTKQRYAIRDAGRLASVFPGKAFIVLKAERLLRKKGDTWKLENKKYAAR